MLLSITDIKITLSTSQMIRTLALIIFMNFSVNSFALERPNILIIMADDMGPRINALGDNVSITPALDDFVKSGTSYVNAFATAGVCACSRSAFLTGKNQISIGSMHMRTSSGGYVPYLAVPSPEIKAFPEILRKFGYYTFTNDKLDYQFSGIFPGTGPFTIWDNENDLYGWKKRDITQPFFGIINLIVTHESCLFYGIPDSLAYLPIMTIQKKIQRYYEAPISPEQVLIPPFYPDTDLVRKDISRLYNNIFILDKQFKDILNELEKDGLLENTIIIFSSDHSDGLPRYKRELFDTGIKVPFIVNWSKTNFATQFSKNTISTDLVSFIDIAPTVLDIVGINIPSYMDGISLLSKKNKYIYAARDRLDDMPGRLRAIRSKNFKFIKNYMPEIVGAQKLAFRENIKIMKELRSFHKNEKLDEVQSQWFKPIPLKQLYNLENDPFEINNLALKREYQNILNELEAELDNWVRVNNDNGAIPEMDLINEFWPNQNQPLTKKPTIQIKDNKIIINNDPSNPLASTGYKINSGVWKVYSDAIDSQGVKHITSKSVKYGWKESEEVSLIIR